jgi:hypothetical protein
MATKDPLHHLVGDLPDDQTEFARVLLEDPRDDVDGPPLDAEALTSLDRGLADIAGGRVKPLHEQTRTRIVKYWISVSHEAKKILDRSRQQRMPPSSLEDRTAAVPNRRFAWDCRSRLPTVPRALPSGTQASIAEMKLQDLTASIPSA